MIGWDSIYEQAADVELPSKLRRNLGRVSGRVVARLDALGLRGCPARCTATALGGWDGRPHTAQGAYVLIGALDEGEDVDPSVIATLADALACDADDLIGDDEAGARRRLSVPNRRHGSFVSRRAVTVAVCDIITGELRAAAEAWRELRAGLPMVAGVWLDHAAMTDEQRAAWDRLDAARWRYREWEGDPWGTNKSREARGEIPRLIVEERQRRGKAA